MILSAMHVARKAGAKHEGPARGTHAGFTLIELLVVIAIIALLVSILLPSLQSAKEMAKTAVCISTMKGVGNAFAQYNTNNKDAFPFSYAKLKDGGRMFWTHCLVEDGVLSSGLKKDTEDLYNEASPLRCASEIPEVQVDVWGQDRSPMARKDKERMKVAAHYRETPTGEVDHYIHSSFGANGCNTESNATYWNWAMPLKWSTRSGGYDAFKLPQFKIAPSEVISIYDGLFCHVSGADYHSQRHNMAKNINILACDGHAESLETDRVSAPDDNSYSSEGLYFERHIKPGNWFLSREDMPHHAYNGGGL